LASHCLVAEGSEGFSYYPRSRARNAYNKQTLQILQ